MVEVHPLVIITCGSMPSTTDSATWVDSRLVPYRGVWRGTRRYAVAGLSAIEARELMRRFDDGQPESMIGSWVDTGSRTGAEVARAFAEDGYLKVYNVDRDGRT